MDLSDIPSLPQAKIVMNKQVAITTIPVHSGRFFEIWQRLFHESAAALTVSIEVYEGDRFTYGETLDIAVAFSRALAQKFQVQRGRAKGDLSVQLSGKFVLASFCRTFLETRGKFWIQLQRSFSLPYSIFRI